MKKTRVLVIDDKEQMRTMYQRFFERAVDMDATIASSGNEGMAKLGEQSFDAVLSDLMIDEINGIEILERAAKSSIRVLILRTGSAYDMDGVKAVIQEKKLSGTIPEGMVVRAKTDPISEVIELIRNTVRSNTDSILKPKEHKDS